MPDEKAPTPTTRSDAMNPMACDCLTWAHEDPTSALLGNGHHVRCEHFKPNVGALDLLRDLLKGIRAWGAEEDGVSELVWEPYRRAAFIVEGRIIPDDPDAAPVADAAPAEAVRLCKSGPSTAPTTQED
jgi:hypothetical protein